MEPAEHPPRPAAAPRVRGCPVVLGERQAAALLLFLHLLMQLLLLTAPLLLLLVLLLPVAMHLRLHTLLRLRLRLPPMVRQRQLSRAAALLLPALPAILQVLLAAAVAQFLWDGMQVVCLAGQLAQQRLRQRWAQAGLPGGQAPALQQGARGWLSDWVLAVVQASFGAVLQYGVQYNPPVQCQGYKLAGRRVDRQGAGRVLRRTCRGRLARRQRRYGRATGDLFRACPGLQVNGSSSRRVR